MTVTSGAFGRYDDAFFDEVTAGAAFLLNIAIVLFGYRRSRDLVWRLIRKTHSEEPQ